MRDSRALLLVDIVGSTHLAEQIGDAAVSTLWASHDRMSRDLLRSWRGREIDKSDGFLLLFADVSSAVGYALDYHRALKRLNPPLWARAGIHFGAIILRENSSADVALGAKPLEIDGIALPFTARVMSIARGGQTLMTAAAKASLPQTGQASLLSCGVWRAKGLEEPFEVFAIAEPNPPFAPPPDSEKAYRVVRRDDLWLPLRELQHTLPAERDAFVGRQFSLAKLRQRFFDSGARLVSVVGAGGIGKTRLAQRFGWTWLGDFPGGVCFCDLTQARSIDGIAHAVAQGLGVPLGRADPLIQLGNAIAGRGTCLIIIDNFEQVVHQAEDTLGYWLDRARQARFLVTSRQVLGISGEEVMNLPPLDPPDAAALFIRRANAASQEFKEAEADRATIDQLVGLLDGLPLAIELAAARVRLLAPRQLLQRMSDRFKVLASIGGRRKRQATLRATFDWSWDLLSAPEQAAFAQLSVFEGGFSLEAAESVLDLSTSPGSPTTLDLLQSLLEKSLLRRVNDHRLGFLASLQDYAAEHLETEGAFPGSGREARSSAHARHWRYFAGLDDAAATIDACVEVDNLVAACRRAAEGGDAEHASAALLAAWTALKLCGPFRVGVDLATMVHAVPGINVAQRIRVERVGARACQSCGRVEEARRFSEAGLSLARTSGAQNAEGVMLAVLAELDLNEARMDDAGERFARALEIAAQSNDPLLECTVRTGLGTLQENLGRFDDAEKNYQRALDISRAIRNRRWEGGALGNLGQLHANRGEMDAAESFYQASLSIACELGDRQWEGNGRCNLGLLHLARGRLDLAFDELTASLSSARQIGHIRLECIVLCNLGLVHEAAGRPLDARDAFEAALVFARALGDRRSEGQFLIYLGLLNARQRRIDEARACLEKSAALLADINDPLTLGLLFCARSESEHLAGARGSAAEALNKARALAESLSVSPESEFGLALGRVSSLMR